MPDAGENWLIESLRADHDQSAFSCGLASLDTFLKKFAGQNQQSGISKTWVAKRPDTPSVCGYYSIAAGAVQFEDLPESLRKNLPKYPIPVAHLGRLAVDTSAQGHGLGELLLIDALGRIVRVADSIGIHAVEVVAIDAHAKQFYLKYGFVELLDDPCHLYIALKTLLKARLT